MTTKTNNLISLWNLFSFRQQRMLKYLSNYYKAVSVAAIARELQSSTRTIRNDIKSLSEILSGTDQVKLLKDDDGYYLNCLDSTACNFLQQQNLFSYIDDRKAAILKKLLISKKGQLTILALSKDLNLSNSSVSRELGSLGGWLTTFNLSVIRVRNRGISLEGREYDKRMALCELLRVIVDKICPGYPYDLSECKVDRVHKDVLQDLLPGFNGDPVIKILSNFEETFQSSISSVQFSSLWFSICVGIYRHNCGYPVELDQIKVNEIKSRNNKTSTPKLLENVFKAYDVFLPEDELAYIFLQLESSGIFRNLSDDELLLSSQDCTFSTFSHEVINTIEGILEISFSSNLCVKRNFLHHLSCAVARLSNGIRIKNPFLIEIKKNYPDVFGATWGCSVLFDKYLNLRVTDDEIGYLALYVATIVKQEHKFIKACIVCNYGVGVSGLLNESLLNCISNLQITHVLSSLKFYELRKQGHLEWDLIISTVKLHENIIPVINIPTILSFQDFERIKSFLNRLPSKVRIKSLTSPTASGSGLINDRNVFTDFLPSDKTGLLKSACELLQNRNHVSEEFFGSLIARELTISTEIGLGIAIPHGNPTFVLTPSILYYRLKNPIAWTSEQKVDMVFVLALKMDPEKSVFEKRFFNKLSLILSDNQMYEAFHQLIKPEDICNFFTEEA